MPQPVVSEPFLPDVVVRAMRHALLEHVAKRGAQTLDELTRLPPSLLMLMLNGHEVRTALDSARRHRLVEPLDPTVRELDRAEWGLTDLGRKAARSPYGSVIDRLASLLQVVVISSTVLVGLLGAATGLAFDLDSLHPRAALALLIVAYLAGQLLVAVMNDRRHRVSRSEIASGWERLAAERPKMHHLHTTKRRFLWPGVAALLLGQAVILIDPEPPLPVLVVVVLCFVAFVATQFRLGQLSTRANREALDAMKALLERMQAADAARPEPAAPPPVSTPA
jgi:hypothetical protein